MNTPVTILVADRNPHIRNFLKRELSSDGYLVLLAQNGKEVIQRVFDQTFINLIIVDPDLPDMDGKELLRRLQQRDPVLTILIHALHPDASPSSPQEDIVFIEKKGNSIEKIKQVVCDLIQNHSGSRPDW